MAGNKSSPTAILGGGAWGLSTALALLEDGYTNVTVFDRASEIPSPYSGGFDLNKIVRAEYEDPFYTKLALEAIQRWKTPFYGPYFHQTGYVVANSSAAPQKAIDHLEHALASVQNHPTFAPGITPLRSHQDFKDIFWQFTGQMTGFKGYYNKLAGYVHSSNAMQGVHQYLEANGVKFILGDLDGKVTKLLYSGDGPSRHCTGLQTADGVTHGAQVTISCLGAYQASLIPEVGYFTVAKSWSVAHVELTEKECDYLRGIPVLNMRDMGFFFEPDPATRLFKLCPLGAGYINTDPKTGISLPSLHSLPPPQDYIPAEDERKLRRLLQETLPWMANRPFVDQKMCWFSDTRDSEYCIDFVPNTNQSLIVLTGDSGHGFKMMPIVGQWCLSLLKDGNQKLSRWQWRDNGTPKQDWGDEVSWRIGTTKEIGEVIAEQNRRMQSKL
ncbi:hypothetical protein BP6252_04980 [Coleophoma cylindrospora]|uniref:FAD dependent oxidoreductase domain-containing protein n=1 Tax=Coleophoma cylindrospora TaxID=1849047 RepID=A0A3D8RS71_9HELO|nr:hypothetical protein BP6252_04980 [Coleophoma cylindrospora]